MRNMSDNQANRIFVGGLSWNTTKEMLSNEFMKYGEIIDAIVMRNPETGASRGYGFITFKDMQSAEMALNSGTQHMIDGKPVDVKTCSYQQRQEMNYPNISLSLSNLNKYNNCKVFVGGLPHGTQDMDVINFFSRFGNVVEFKMMYDETKQKPRGFGFITFEQEESAVQVLKQQYFQFNGKQIEVKPQNQNVKQKQLFPSSYSQMTQQQQGYMGNWNNQRGNNWNNNGNPSHGHNSHHKGNYRNNMQSQYQNQQWGNHGYPSNNNLFPIQPQSNWNNYNFYGQTGGGQANGFFPLDGTTAAIGAAAGYSS